MWCLPLGPAEEDVFFVHKSGPRKWTADMPESRTGNTNRQELMSLRRPPGWISVYCTRECCFHRTDSKSLWMLAKIMLRLSGENRRGTAANAVKKSWTSAKGSRTNPNGADTNSVKKLVQWIQNLLTSSGWRSQCNLRRYC